MPLRLNRSTSLTTSISRKTNGSGRLSSAQHSPYIRFQCLLSGSPKRPVIVQKRNRVRPVMKDLPPSSSKVGRVRSWLSPVAWLRRDGAHQLLFPTLPHNSPAHRSRRQPRQHRQQTLRSLLQKEKHPGNPVQTRCRRCPCHSGGESRLVPVAVHPDGRACQAGRQHRTASAACPPMWCRGQARGRAGSAVSLDFCDDCKEPCLNSITVCGWVRC